MERSAAERSRYNSHAYLVVNHPSQNPLHGSKVKKTFGKAIPGAYVALLISNRLLRANLRNLDYAAVLVDDVIVKLHYLNTFVTFGKCRKIAL